MSLDIPFMIKTFRHAFSGLGVTLQLVFVPLLISALPAFWMALVRMKGSGAGSSLIRGYVSFVRGTPVVLQILFLYSLLPTLLNHVIKNVLHLSFNIFQVDAILYAYVVFVMNTTANLSEVFRSALFTVDGGQMEAALSIGLSVRQAYLRIVIPQALRAALPNLCNTAVNLLKSSSLAFLMTVKDITAVAKIDASFGYKYIEAYLVILIFYILLCSAVQGGFRLLERLVEIRDRTGQKERRTAVC